MSSFWWIQLFWLALAVPGYALLRRWDPGSLQHGVLFALGRCYLASMLLLTPVSALGYLLRWPLWSLSAAYLWAVACGAGVLIGDLWLNAAPARNWPRPSFLAAVGGIALCLDVWLGVRAGTHLQGDAGYHIARIRLLVNHGLNNWDPIVADHRFDLIYHTNLYHALIASGAQLTHSDAAQAWLATWPFAKLLTAAGAFQLATSVFRSRECGWLASLTTLAAQSAYALLPFPNTLAPMALLPMGLCAGAALLGSRRAVSDVVWLAASALALAQFHMLNAVFLALIVAPCLLVSIALCALRRRKGKLILTWGLLACGASLPWLVVAAQPRIEAMLQSAEAPPPTAASADAPTQPTVAPPSNAADGAKKRYKAEHFRKLDNGLPMYEPTQLLGARNTNLVALLLLLVTLALSPRGRNLWSMVAFVGVTCAWLLVPPLCAVLLQVTSAPWAAMRITQALAIAWLIVIVAAPWSWLTRLRLRGRTRMTLQLPAAGIALLVGLTLHTHGEPWTQAALWSHARDYQALSEWQTLRARQTLLCEHIPAGETVMAHPRWDYALPMLCSAFTVALAPERGWHGMPYMAERRADIDEFFGENTSGERRLALMNKYQTQHVYTTNRLARRIVQSLPERSRVLASAKLGAVVFVDL